MNQQLSSHSSLERMIRQQIIGRGIRDERVVQAMRDTPRDRFVPVDLKPEAYADGPLSIGHDQTISQPYIVALMTRSLAVAPHHRVLEIGTGSGYQTAILARLALEVFTMERIKPLLDLAFDRLLDMGLRNVHFRHGDGSAGWPEQGPFDRILIAAAAPRIPEALLMSHLAEGGQTVLPVGPADSNQQLLLIVKKDGQLQSTELCPVRFVKLIGEQGWEK